MESEESAVNYLSMFKFKPEVKNKKFPALTIISSLLKIFALITLIFGFLISLIMAIEITSNGSGGSGFASFLIGVIGSIIGFILQWALAEIILVFLDMEKNTEDIVKLLQTSKTIKSEEVI
ncbi:MAG: hypothetical protein ACYCSB_06995 [bacterium]|jgi:hypothetical protein